MITAPDPRLAAGLADRYRLERELGQGGMATVYLAHDLRHDRKVALKVLRPELAAILGAERFLAEIKTTANLQHPHILPLFDSGQVDQVVFYVMPYVEGESLRDRLNRERQLPIADAVRIAAEVASALDYAHRHHVVHRDIKPENILLHDGQALVADFGIALAVSSAGGTRMTETGLSLGTPHYMSPEQAMGEREISARSDIYALGCVSYEMLTGEPPFTGHSAQAIVARVLSEEPRGMRVQRKSIPPQVEVAVLTALEKLPADRFASAAEFAAALTSDALPHTVVSRHGPGRRAQRIRGGRPLALVAVGGVILGALAGFLLHSPTAAPIPLTASFLPPAGCSFQGVGSSNLVQLSPDGARLAFVAECGGAPAIWVRELATGEMKALKSTTNAIYPFWSADGTSLGFFSEGSLKRVDLATGAIRVLAPAPGGRGGTWSQDGTIVFAPDIFGPLVRVSENGGTPERATVVEDTTRDTARAITHRNPYFLPDGKTFLFAQGDATGENGTVRVARLGSTASRQLLDVGSNVYFAHGRLFYVRDGVLVSQPFDPGSGTLSGTAQAIIPQMEIWQPKFLGNFSISGSMLVYRDPLPRRARVLAFDPRTKAQSQILPEGGYYNIAMSPDGKRLLVSRTLGEEALPSLWMYDLTSDTWAQVSETRARTLLFGWFPDGKRFFEYNNSDRTALQIINAGDRSLVDSVSRADAGIYPILDVAPDASYAVGVRQVANTGFDILRLDLTTGTHRLEPLLASPTDEGDARISPDGRMLAYMANRTGRYEVMVAALPDVKVQWQVSRNGAGGFAASFIGSVAWARDNRTLYYADPDQRLALATLAPGGGIQFLQPRLVDGAPGPVQTINVAPDGRLVLLVAASSGEVPLTLVTDWPSLLHERR